MNRAAALNVPTVEIRRIAGAYRIFRDKRPFYVRGAGGFSRLDQLAARGANSVRTWGSDQTFAALPEIRQLGLTLCAGLWMKPPRAGFDYRDARRARAQEDRLMSEVERLRGEHCLLFWGVGNELDLQADAPEAWDAVESLAARIKQRDSRPVITVISEPRADTLQRIAARCPSLDALGINSYADAPGIATALDRVGWDRPYLVTEWGSDGGWEVERTPWGASIEPTSARKAEQVRERYLAISADSRRCLGSYAFFWGCKQEITPTWFNLLAPDGGEYEAVAALAELWSEDSPLDPQALRLASDLPSIESLRVKGETGCARLRPSEWTEAAVELAGAGAERGALRWEILRESPQRTVGGDFEPPSERVETSVERNGSPWKARFRAPPEAGAYRLFVYASFEGKRRSTANLPFLVE